MERDEAADFKFYHGIAKVVSVLVNVHRDSEKYPEGFSELDFIPAHLVPPKLRKHKPGRPDKATGNVVETRLNDVVPRDFLFEVFQCGVDKRGKVVKKPKQRRFMKAK